MKTNTRALLSILAQDNANKCKLHFPDFAICVQERFISGKSGRNFSRIKYLREVSYL